LNIADHHRGVDSLPHPLPTIRKEEGEEPPLNKVICRVVKGVNNHILPLLTPLISGGKPAGEKQWSEIKDELKAKYWEF